MKTLLIALIAWQAQPVPLDLQLQRLFEAGRYQDVIDRLDVQSAEPPVLYLGAHSYEQLERPVRALELLERLVARDPEDVWHHIGRSAILLANDDAEQALAHAAQAVALNPKLPEAHYQLGLVQGHRVEFKAAAEAFDQAGRLEPAFAYAHYHAGLSYYRIKRIDLMAARFEMFLKVAPEAPERPQVESIMRTVRGR